ncbi:hypothetical protein GCM10010156_35780 [Planobispora rosea]|uniref:Secreted protein n=1 Tax=Planobispora rosea TaxID=35762 RepID=A0A8J3RWW3_PLARO|nr:DUF6049 family protein [Planobispora rosea]GGS73722.1 hypothetical protein GCM10010156_35780 [Planobispora rosea]GIH81651.1 hypothetical protein Pro02_00590 [Planobispora rosea]
MIRKATLLAVLTATLLSPAAVALPGTASAQVNTASAGPSTASRQTVRLVPDELGPDLIREPDAKIRISGSLINNGKEVLSNLYVRMSYAGRPFTQRAQMSAYLSGQPGSQPGSWLVENYQQPIAPSGKAAWEFAFTPQELGISRFGVYPVMVQVLDSLRQEVAALRTFITYLPRDATVPRTRLAVVLPIVDQPRRADDATFVDGGLPAAMASGKRLGNLLKIAQDTSSVKGITWVVDPALLDDARAAGATHWSRTKGKTERRPGDPAATRWLDDLKTALADPPVVVTPYADPDVTALAHNGLDDVTATGVETGGRTARELLGREVRTDVAWPVGGMIDYDGLDLLATSGVGTVLLNSTNLPLAAATTAPDGTTGVPVTPPATPDAVAPLSSVGGPVRALVADPVLSETLGAATSAPGAALQSRRRFIAETAMISAESAVDPGTAAATGTTGTAAAAPAKTVLVVPPRRWSPDPAYVTDLVETAASLPWLTPTTLDSVKPAKGPAAPAARADLTYTPQDRGNELGKTYMGGIRRVGARADLTAAITKVQDVDPFDRALLRLSSSAWRGRTDDAAPYVERVRETIDTWIAKVAITGNELSQIRTLAGQDGEVPISVRNDLEGGDDKIVRVRVKVTSGDRKLLKIEPYDDLMEIHAGRAETIRVPMTASGSGQTTVTVQLTTEDERKYGQRVRLTVRTTGYTGIALVIVGAALVVMLAAVVMRILRRRGARRAAAVKPPARQPAVPAGNES